MKLLFLSNPSKTQSEGQKHVLTANGELLLSFYCVLCLGL